MSYKLTFTEYPQYLYALVEGIEDSYAVSKAYWTEIVQKLNTTQYEAAIVHEKIVETASVEEVFKLVNEFATMGLTAYKIAFVDEVLDQQSVNQFGEVLAISLGLDGRVFNNLSEAECWIKSTL